LWAGDVDASSVAVLPLSGSVDAPTRDAWTAALRDAVGALDGVTVLPATVVADALVTADALGTACPPTTVPCIARLGALATAGLAVGGRIEARPAGITITLVLVDVPRSGRIREIELPVNATPVPSAARLLATRLLAPERERAFVVVRGALAGSTVSIDGEVRGTTPLAEPIEVRPGRHEVVVDHIQHDSESRVIDVAFDDTAVVELDTRTDHAGLADVPETTRDDPTTTTTSTPAGVRVRLARVRVDRALPSLTASRFSDHLRTLLHHTPGVVVVGDLPSAELSSQIADRAREAVDVDEIVFGGTAVVDTPEIALDADVHIIVDVVRLGKTVVVSARGMRLSPMATRPFETTFVGDDIDGGLRRIAPALLSTTLRDEPIGPIPDDTAGGALPRWVLWSTIAAGGASAVVAGSAGAAWWAGGGQDATLGALCVAGTAASTALAVAVAVEAMQLQ
jgi:hypothetical protein